MAHQASLVAGRSRKQCIHPPPGPGDASGVNSEISGDQFSLMSVLFLPLALAAMNGSLQARCLLFPMHVLHSLCHTLLRVMDGSREFAVQSGHGVESGKPHIQTTANLLMKPCWRASNTKYPVAMMCAFGVSICLFVNSLTAGPKAAHAPAS